MTYFYIENFSMEEDLLSSLESEGKSLISGIEKDGEKALVGAKSEAKDIEKKVEQGASSVLGKDVVKKAESSVSSLGSGA